MTYITGGKTPLTLHINVVALVIKLKHLMWLPTAVYLKVFSKCPARLTHLLPHIVLI